MAQPSTIAAMVKKVMVDPAHTAKVLSVRNEAFQYSLQKRGCACGCERLCQSMCRTNALCYHSNAYSSQQVLVRGPVYLSLVAIEA